MGYGKKIETATLKELFGSATDGSIPVLMDIQHPNIIWDKEAVEDGKENGHLRIINANYKVRYENKWYSPARFNFTLPSEDGKTVGNASITITAIDKRIVKVIRSIPDKPIASIVAMFVRRENDIHFSKLFHYEFEMNSVSWDGVSAKWNLVFDPTAQLNVPRDLATVARCPAINVSNNS